MVSPNTLAFLPQIQALQKLSQALAMLESILCSRRDYRYYTFDSKWGEGEMMASMSNGTGDDYFLLFNAAGAILKGFDHESEMSPYATDQKEIWPGVLEDMPSEFREFLSESTITIAHTTFCLWKRYTDTAWRTGTINYPDDDKDADGSAWILSILNGEPSSYHDFAEEYYERPVDIEAVRHVYEHKPLTEEIVRSLNADRSLEDLSGDIEEIGYPSGARS